MHIVRYLVRNLVYGDALAQLLNNRNKKSFAVERDILEMHVS